MAAIVGLVSSLVGPSIEVGKFIAAPLKKQFNYLFCFNNNIQSLKDEADKLEDVRVGLQMKVDTANRNADTILPEVETWLTSVKNDQAKINGIYCNIPNVRSGILKVKARYSLSRQANKMADVIKGRIDDGRRFEQVSNPAPPASMGSIPSSTTKDFESRKHVEERIMSALREKNVNVIGICGMGGVGKTTMAKRIMKRVREENMFDEVVMAVVSQQADISKMQQQIADNLGLTLGVETLSARAHKLQARIKGTTKRILIVLDDVWNYLKLEELGIPREGGFDRCKILLTSRDQGVLIGMEAHKVISVDVLSEEEAWFLFSEKAGGCVNHKDLYSIANEVSKECKGLPVALVTLGLALKDKKISVWHDALRQLRKSNPIDIPNVLKEVYNPLKLSYDFLESEHAKSLFLLCSLFEEDFNIPLENLTQYVVGLRIFEETLNLEEARNRIWTLTDMLKSRSLLQDGNANYRVKMHDVVRDMALFIASKEDSGIVIYLNDRSMDLSIKESFKWISIISKGITNTTMLPLEKHFPNLQLLMMENLKALDIELMGNYFHVKEEDLQALDIESLDNFFQGTEKLNVVSFETIAISSLPQSAKMLINLRTLRLHRCTIETIAVVGELVNLEILSCSNCESIQELPMDIGKLSHLRLLELYMCRVLKSIPPGVISKLIRLEELKIRGSFSEWEGKEGREGRRNASLTELECLQRLSWLEIEISDISLATMDIRLSSNIVRYDIRISLYKNVVLRDENLKKKVFLHLSSEISFGNWIHTFLRSTEWLHSEGDGLNRLDLSGLKNMEALDFCDCSTVNKLVNDVDLRNGIFPALRNLKLSGLCNIEEICNGPIPVEANLSGNISVANISFGNLRYITISNCGKLRNLGPLSLARYFSQLESLEIEFCEAMEEVFTSDEKDGQGDHVPLPKLVHLSLEDLPRLTTFFKGIEYIEFPQINFMRLSDVLQLRSFSSTKTQLNLAGHEDSSFHIFCHQKVFTLKSLLFKSNATNIWCPQIPTGFFKQLEELEITAVKATSLFSSSIVANLVNLEILTVDGCEEMITVISDEEQVSENSVLIMPRLRFLSIGELPKLGSFCGWKHAIKLPLLNYVGIDNCPQMETFTVGSLSTENLERIVINWEETETKDLNAAVQQYHLKLLKEDRYEDEDQEYEDETD